MYKNIPAYNILKVCGQGAYGTVYIAENTLSLQKVALKVLHGKQQSRELEGLIKYREIRHKNLLQIHHVDRTLDGQLYYTMDLADNANSSEEEYVADTFAYRLERDGRIDPSCLKEIILDLLDGLEKLHKAKLLHRDIKPDNILFINGQAVLADIGLTTTVTSAKALGTPQFMPKKDISCYNDIYALGMVCYCGLTNLSPANFPKVPKDLQGANDLIKVCTKVCSNEISLDDFRELLTSKPKNAKRYFLWRIVLGFVLILCVAFVAVNLLKNNELKHENMSPVSRSSAIESPLKKLTWDEYFSKIDELKKKYKLSDSFEQKLREYYKKASKEQGDFVMNMHENHDEYFSAKILDYVQEREKKDILYKLSRKLMSLDESIKNGAILRFSITVSELETSFKELKDGEAQYLLEQN